MLRLIWILRFAVDRFSGGKKSAIGGLGLLGITCLRFGSMVLT